MLEFVVVGEAEADVRHASALADRVIAEEGPEWIRDQEPQWLRAWAGIRSNTSHSTWSEVHQLSKKATPNPKREAWVLNGFISTNDREESALASIRQELTFDPCEEAERLRYASGTSRSERNPKEILSRLSGGSPEREERCWVEIPLTILRQRGGKTLLATYLDEVKDLMLPLFQK